ncbi:hypothetical protein PC121_g10330 [Phytophthora cactorum]|nr:hypothetical protein PC121_g10330 [Phytophthora cactorum]
MFGVDWQTFAISLVKAKMLLWQRCMSWRRTEKPPHESECETRLLPTALIALQADTCNAATRDDRHHSS